MKERPILFSGSMVRALLANTKTQTRRIMKPQPSQSFLPDAAPCNYSRVLIDRKTGEQYPDPLVRFGVSDENEDYPCKFGRPGDRLYVKETFAPCSERENHAHAKAGYTYRADWLFEDEQSARDFHWKPSIFCTRAASRITLEITDVRAERLNAISEEDARAEGGPAILGYIDEQKRKHGWMSYREWYQSLWESINGPGSWEANPWVWVVSFRRVEP